MAKGKTIVLAERVEDVVIITPRTLDRARGVLSREVLATKDIAGQPGYRDLWDAIIPCMVTNSEWLDERTAKVIADAEPMWKGQIMAENSEILRALRDAAAWDREMEHDGGRSDLLSRAADALEQCHGPEPHVNGSERIEP